ncbi:hypothetical protein OESDEN_25443, partial [Oesophagostomum dentatum]
LQNRINSFQESYQRSESSKQESTRAIPVQPVTSSIQENYQRRTTSTTQETTHAVPVPVPVQPMSSLQVRPAVFTEMLMGVFSNI